MTIYTRALSWLAGAAALLTLVLVVLPVSHGEEPNAEKTWKKLNAAEEEVMVERLGKISGFTKVSARVTRQSGVWCTGRR